MGLFEKLLCFQISGASISLLWWTNTNYSYVDFSEHMPNSLGTNGIAAGCGYLYTTDGVSLDQRSLLTGALIKNRNAIFTFLHHPKVPPDNNGSERAIRNAKVKMKVSNQFKSLDGAQCFAILR